MDHFPEVVGFLLILEILLKFLTTHIAKIADFDFLLYLGKQSKGIKTLLPEFTGEKCQNRKRVDKDLVFIIS
jgi:hypothetical protein